MSAQRERGAQQAGQPARFLITSIGVPRNGYEEVTYVRDGRPFRTRFAPVATARLCNLRGAKALVLVTPKAKAISAPEMIAELRQDGLDVEEVPIESTLGPGAVDQMLEALYARVPEGAQVYLDVTFALRHLPFVYNAAMAYLSALRDVTIRGVYYGAFELREGEQVPMFDLSATFTLVEWYWALRTFRDSGRLAPVVNVLGDSVDRMFRASHSNDAPTAEVQMRLGTLRGRLKRLVPLVDIGLPLEAGIVARDVLDALDDLEGSGRGPATASVIPSVMASRELRKHIEVWAVPGRVNGKQAVALTDGELERQLAISRWLAERGRPGDALIILREWMVNLLLKAVGGEPAWLDREKRLPAEWRLNAAIGRVRASLANDDERQLSRYWDRIKTKRNAIAHAGMTEENAGLAEASVRVLIEECQPLPREVDLGAVARPGELDLLVTPLGLSPGVLYTALVTVRPEACIVLTSKEGRQHVAAAIERAEWDAQDGRLLVHVFDDPHAGFSSIRRLTRSKEVRKMLVAAERVIVNITGGTTLLHYAAEEIGREAYDLAVPVQRVALVDRRPYEEQQRNPWLAGEIVPLRAEEPESDAGA